MHKLLEQEHAAPRCHIGQWTLGHKKRKVEGFLHIIETKLQPSHILTLEIAKKLNIDTMTNATIRKKLDLSVNGEKHLDIPPAETLGRYFGEYSVFAKAYRTKEIPNPFFWEIAKFLLEVGCVHVNLYGMPKQKAVIIIDTFEGRAIDWDVITGPTLREGLHTY